MSYTWRDRPRAPTAPSALDRAAAGRCRATPGGWPADGRRRRQRRRRRRQRRRRRRQRRRLALDGINDGSLYQCNVSMPLCLVYAAPGTVAGVESRGGGGGSTGTGRCESHSRAHDWSGGAPRGGCDVRIRLARHAHGEGPGRSRSGPTPPFRFWRPLTSLHLYLGPRNSRSRERAPAFGHGAGEFPNTCNHEFGSAFGTNLTPLSTIESYRLSPLSSAPKVHVSSAYGGVALRADA
jgi:hypothetical protein